LYIGGYSADIKPKVTCLPARSFLAVGRKEKKDCKRKIGKKRLEKKRLEES
jgi:hypothetical protein